MCPETLGFTCDPSASSRITVATSPPTSPLQPCFPQCSTSGPSALASGGSQLSHIENQHPFNVLLQALPAPPLDLSLFPFTPPLSCPPALSRTFSFPHSSPAGLPAVPLTGSLPPTQEHLMASRWPPSLASFRSSLTFPNHLVSRFILLHSSYCLRIQCTMYILFIVTPARLGTPGGLAFFICLPCHIPSA